MTAEEWDQIRWLDDAYPALEPAAQFDRKLRLFVVACFRASLDHLPDVRARNVIDASEAFADDHAQYDSLSARIDALDHRDRSGPNRMVLDAAGIPSATFTQSASRYRQAVELLIDARTRSKGPFDRRILEQEQRWREQFAFLAILRDIFGNPFRPVAFDPAWRTEHTTGLAAKMYDERDFRAMPILADALEEAGCDNSDILTHCREQGEHVRGCWVVDFVLGL